MAEPIYTSQLDYELPKSLIAQTVVEPRDSSRLLVVDGMCDKRFNELPSLLESGDLLVVNRTRVRAARIAGYKPDTGGAVELLLLRREDDRWQALIKPARRIRVGTRLIFGPIRGVVTVAPVDGVVEVSLTVEGAADIDDVLPSVGTVPLPPYFSGELDDPERYQTVFAKTIGSAAAPTAALHFTPELVDRLKTAGVTLVHVELDVGLDTFRPIGTETIDEHVIHSERYVVPPAAADAIAATKAHGKRVVAVGTTVVRTLETAGRSGVIAPGEGVSTLFIRPGHVFCVVDAMITNFHAPRTSLIALVAAAIGPDWRAVYDHAMENHYRFLSFGDAMFITGLEA